MFPDTDVRVKPMMTLPAINTGTSEHEKEQINRTVQKNELAIAIAPRQDAVMKEWRRKKPPHFRNVRNTE
ncbi:hypothetical protein WDR79_002042 [Citrobacter freundii]